VVKVYTDNSVFTNNRAPDEGGAVQLYISTLTLIPLIYL